jgi:hypothetical protein
MFFEVYYEYAPHANQGWHTLPLIALIQQSQVQTVWYLKGEVWQQLHLHLLYTHCIRFKKKYQLASIVGD